MPRRVAGGEELGSRWHIQDSQGLGVRVAQAARTPGGLGVCGGPGRSSLEAALTPMHLEAGFRSGSRGGESWA